jgi:Tol biopolymer transport system component
VIFDAILNRIPAPPSRVNPELPPGLERIITKALEKDRDLRYQSAADLRGDLKRLKRDTDSGRSAAISLTEVLKSMPGESSAPARQSPSRVPFLIAAISLVVLAVAGFVIYKNRSVPATPAAIPTRLTQISRWNKPMFNARLSRDGHTVAFSSISDAVSQVFIMLTAGGEPLQLTRDEGDKTIDSFSPDGTEIYYRRFLGHDEVWAVPTLGGVPHRVLSGIGLAPTDDGSGMFYLKSVTPAVFRADKSGLGEEEVFNFGKPSINLASVLPFPNNRELLVSGIDAFEPHLYRIDLSTRMVTDLGTVSGQPEEPVWLEPGKSIVFSRTVNGLTNIWKYSLADKSLTQVTTGSGPDASPMPDPSGKGIYYVSGKTLATLTQYQVKTKTNSDILSDDVSQPIMSPNAKRIMYARYLERGRSEVWVADIDGSNKLKLASGTTVSTFDWSPDGSQVAFADDAPNGSHLYVVGADGRGLREIKGIEGAGVSGIWSGDGRLFVTTSDLSIWAAAADGSHVEKLLAQGFFAAAPSTDNKYVVGYMFSGVKVGIQQLSVPDKQPKVLLPGVATFMVHFAPDSRSFLYMTAGKGEVTFYRQAWQNGNLVGTPQVALKIPFAFSPFYKGNAFDFSHDLSSIVYARPSGQHDLYLLSR